MTEIEIAPVGYLGPMPVDRIISWSLTATVVWIVGVIAFIVLRLVFKSRWETFDSRWRTLGEEASDDPALDPDPEIPSGEAIFENAVTEAVETAVEALHELPAPTWVTWRLADIVRDAAITTLDMYETACENENTLDPEERAAEAVLAAWHRHIRESSAFNTYESAVPMCDRMDAATAATREHLAAEWMARLPGKNTR